MGCAGASRKLLLKFVGGVGVGELERPLSPLLMATAQAFSRHDRSDTRKRDLKMYMLYRHIDGKSKWFIENWVGTVCFCYARGASALKHVRR